MILNRRWFGRIDGVFGCKRPEWMRRVAWLTLLLLLAFATTHEVLAQATRLRVGIYNNHPLSFVDEQGRPQGIIVEILQEISREEGWQLEFVPCEWSSCLQMLESGQIDLLGAIAYTEERAKRFDFNEQAYFANWGVVYTRPDNVVQSLIELDGKSIASVEEDVYTLGLRDLLNRLGLHATYLPARDYDAVLEMVESKEADVGVVARLYGLVHESDYKVRSSPIILSPVQLRYAATKGKHQAVLRKIDDYLEAWKRDPQSPYHQTLSKWLNHRPTRWNIPPWLGWTMGGLVAWAVLAAFTVIFLRRQISRQTQALQTEREYLQAVLDAVENGIFIHDADTFAIVDANRRACELYGYSYADLLLLSIGDLSHGQPPYSQTEATAWLQQSRVHGPQVFEWQARHKDGHLFWVEMSVRFAIIGGRNSYVVAVHDMTARKKAQEKARSAEARLRALVEQVPAIVYTESATEKGKMLYLSPQIVDLLGYFPNAWVEEAYGWRRYIHPDDLERVLAEDERSTEAGAPFSVEYRLIKESGETVWVQDDAVLIRDEDGQPLFWQGVMHDITARKQAEERVLRHLAELQALYENGIVVSRSLWPSEIGQSLVETFSKLLGWEHVTVRLRRGTSDELELISFTEPGLTTEQAEEIKQRFQALVYKIGQGLSGWAAQTGQIIRVGDVRSDPRYIDTHSKVKSGLYAPLKAGERVIGCISVESEDLDAFSEQDERLLATLATQAAVAFENARLYQEALQEVERRTVLHRASQEIVSCGLDLEALYRAAHRAVCGLMPADIFTIALLDENQNEIEGVYYVEQGKRYPHLRFKVSEGFSGYVIQSNQSLCLDDYSSRAAELPFRPVQTGMQTIPRSVLAVPLRFGTRVIGAMSIQCYEANRYTHQDQTLLEMLAAYTGYALENARLFNAEREQRRLSDALREALGAGASLSSTLEFESILDRLLEELEQVVPFQGGCVMFVEADKETIRIARTRGYKKLKPEALEGIRALRFKISSTANLRWMYENREPLIIPDVRKYPGWVRVKEASFARSWAGAPILVAGDVVAFFSLDAVKTGFFTEEHKLLLKAFAGQASLALENARLFEQTRRRADRLSLLNKVSEQLSGLMTLDAIGETIVPVIESLLGWERGSIWLIEDDGSLNMLYHSTPGFTGEARQKELQRLRSLNIRPGVGIVGWVAQTGEVVRCGDVRQDSRYIEGDVSIRSELCVPLRIQNRIIGCINFESQRENAFTEEDEQIAVTLAGEIASTVERSRLYEQTRCRAEELARLASENERLFAETKRRLQFVSALHTIDTAIASSLDIRLTLNVILDHVLTYLNVDVATVYLLNPHLHELEFATSRGSMSVSLYASSLPLNEPTIAGVLDQRKTIEISDLRSLSTLSNRQAQFLAEGFIFYFAYPLIAKGEVKGVLELLKRTPLKVDVEWLEYVRSLAGQAALAVDASGMFAEIQRANAELSVAYDATIEGWSSALDLRDEETEGHTQRVTELTLRLARQMGVSEAELIHIWRGALLHDIGKMAVPDSILRKPGPLTEQEQQIMQRHPVDAFDLLSKINYLRPALDIPYCHHERWDGSGYPRGLKGEQIPLAARIFAVVDVWDALCSDRPYRKAWRLDDALEYIIRNAGKHFDPRVVDAFVTMIKSKK